VGTDVDQIGNGEWGRGEKDFEFWLEERGGVEHKGNTSRRKARNRKKKGNLADAASTAIQELRVNE